MKKPSVDALDALVKKLASEAKLNSWNSFVETLQVPTDLLPALMSERAELIKLIAPRPLTAEEMAAIYKLIGGLVETNRALRIHAEQVAILVSNWSGAFVALRNAGEKIKSFARFEPLYEAEEGGDDREGGIDPGKVRDVFLGRGKPGSAPGGV